MIDIINHSKAEIGGGFAPSNSMITSMSLSLTATNTTVTSATLINATIILLMREIVPYVQAATADESNREFSFDSTTGTITFETANPTDAESIYVLYYPTPSSGQTQAIEPVSLVEAKAQLRVTFTDDDLEIYRLITKARQAIENYCNISIVTKRITLMAKFHDTWDLPFGPVTGLESVQTRISQTGSGPVSYETATTNWEVDGDRFDPAGCIRYKIVYTTGFSSCPEDLKQAILAQISYLYENRGVDASEIGIVQQALDLAAPYKKMLWI